MFKLFRKYNYRLPKHFKNKGYALLFTVILVSIISLIAIGLSNTTYKQMVLSSGAHDSELAFYESDMAMECALYADNQISLLTNGSTSFTCGVDDNGQPYSLNIVSSVINSTETKYVLTPTGSVVNSLNPCFDINIVKDNLSSITQTTISANGYNMCNKSGNRAVERTIEASY